MTNVVAIIQARLDSERLPGKVLLQCPPESGISMLEMTIRKCFLATEIDTVCVVTPDSAIATIPNMLGVSCFVKDWPGRDVVREYWEAANYLDTDVIVRITADCPLVQPQEIDRCVKFFLTVERSFTERDYDLVYNTDEEHGQLQGEGSDVEVFSFEAIRTTMDNAPDNMREHVTTWMRKTMRTRFLEGAPTGLRSINTQEDYEWLCRYLKGA